MDSAFPTQHRLWDAKRTPTVRGKGCPGNQEELQLHLAVSQKYQGVFKKHQCPGPFIDPQNQTFQGFQESSQRILKYSRLGCVAWVWPSRLQGQVSQLRWVPRDGTRPGIFPVPRNTQVNWDWCHSELRPLGDFHEL